MRQPLLIPILYNKKEKYQNVEYYGVLHKGYKFGVEEGFICDGASVPRLLWPWMPPDGLHRPASLFHDRIFAGSGYVPYLDSNSKLKYYKFTLWEADWLFRNLMIEAGVNKIRANITWAALKLGSWNTWYFGKHNVDIQPVRLESIVKEKKSTNKFTKHLYAE